MLRRCHDPSRADYSRYGGRGITVCGDWHSICKFHADMGDAPAKMSLDRIDNDGPYSKENCRWADIKTQNRNSRQTRFVIFDGKRISVPELADMAGVTGPTIKRRIKEGWTIEESVSKKRYWGTERHGKKITYNGKSLKICEWARLLNIKDSSIRHRLEMGYPLAMVFSQEKFNSWSHPTDKQVVRRQSNLADAALKLA